MRGDGKQFYMSHADVMDLAPEQVAGHGSLGPPLRDHGTNAGLILDEKNFAGAYQTILRRRGNGATVKSKMRRLCDRAHCQNSLKLGPCLESLHLAGTRRA